MLEPPPHVTGADVLAAVRRHWAPEVDEVTYLAVGWGARSAGGRTTGAPTQRAIRCCS